MVWRRSDWRSFTYNHHALLAGGVCSCMEQTYCITSITVAELARRLRHLCRRFYRHGDVDWTRSTCLKEGAKLELEWGGGLGCRRHELALFHACSGLYGVGGFYLGNGPIGFRI